MPKQKYDSRGIANVILEKAWARDIQITKMSLIKLVYVVHGWSLAFFDEALVEDIPQAWKFGPVYPRLYKKLAGYTSQPVNMLLLDKDFDLPYPAYGLSKGAHQLIEDILTSYGGMSAFELSGITHREGSPWSQVNGNGQGLYAEIPEKILKKYYVDLREQREIDASKYNI